MIETSGVLFTTDMRTLVCVSLYARVHVRVSPLEVLQYCLIRGLIRFHCVPMYISYEIENGENVNVCMYVCNSCNLQDFMPDQTFDENVKEENDPLQMEQSDQSSQLP